MAAAGQVLSEVVAHFEVGEGCGVVAPVVRAGRDLVARLWSELQSR